MSFLGRFYAQGRNGDMIHLVMRALAAPLGLFCLFLCGSFGQSIASRPRFEAASVKVAPPSQHAAESYLLRGGPGTREPGQVTFTPTPLKPLIMLAYDLPNYQISGPDWLD